MSMSAGRAATLHRSVAASTGAQLEHAAGLPLLLMHLFFFGGLMPTGSSNRPGSIALVPHYPLRLQK